MDGAEIARRQEKEIMVVRDAVGKGRGAARGIDGVARRGPQIGAQVKAARAAVEQEDLRRIAVDLELVGIARRERGDNAIGEEVAVAPEPGEEVCALRDAFLLRELDAAFVEARGDFGEVERGTGGGGYALGRATVGTPSLMGISYVV